MKTDRTTKTLRPVGRGTWRPRGAPHLGGTMVTRRWDHLELPLVVLSSHGLANAPDGSEERIRQWHLSMSARRRLPGGHQEPARPTAEHLALVVETFELEEWQIDNHHPGAAVHFWIPVDPARRTACECKADELVVVEPDGYTWTTPIGGPCRGCPPQNPTGRPCPIHATGLATFRPARIGR